MNVTLTGDITIVNGGAPVETCTGDDAADTDGDGCAYDGTTLTIGHPVNRIITVSQAEQMTVTFDVTID